MMSPIVSVIIPCYNAEKYLSQCVDSIRNQTLKQIEIICVDDGSTDATLEILRSYQTQDSRIRLIQQKNAGAGAARNAGMECASGEYLSFLDADDFFEPDMLEKAVEAAEKWQADYVVFRSDRYYTAEDRYEAIPWSLRSCDLPPYMPFSYRQLTDNVFLTFVGWAWDKVFRRSFVEQHRLRFQEQRTTNDMLFVFSALVCAKRIAAIQDVLAHQRRGSADTLSVTREKSWHCFYDALIALRERLHQENVYWELEKDYINYSLHFCLWHLNSLAEPSHTLLKQKLREEWFAELGIADKSEGYFYRNEEYRQFRSMMGKMKSGEQRAIPERHCEHEPIPELYFNRYVTEKVVDNTSIDGIWVQFDTLRDQLMVNAHIWERYKKDYWRRKYLLGKQAKGFADEYYLRSCRELNRALELGQIEKGFFSGEEWSGIQHMINRADGTISLMRSVSIIRRLSPYIPKSVKKRIIHILKMKK